MSDPIVEPSGPPADLPDPVDTPPPAPEPPALPDPIPDWGSELREAVTKLAESVAALVPGDNRPVKRVPWYARGSKRS